MSALVSDPTTLSAAAERRLRQPRHRGACPPMEAARRQLALLSVADTLGQGRIYWLVDLTLGTITDARFLGFGSRSSHALLDCLSELAIGRTVEGACQLTTEQIECLLRDDPATPAVPTEDLAFIADLQRLALQELPTLALLPKPPETPGYTRKRQQEWDAQDQAWLPLSYLKKIGKVDGLLARTLRARMGAAAPTHRIESLNHDFEIAVTLSGLPAEQVATLEQVLSDAARSELHPRIHIRITPA